MASKGDLIVLVLLYWSSFGLAKPFLASPNVFDVVHFGAVGNGKTDDSNAFLKAWATACAAPQPSTLIIPPKQTFLLNPVTFRGPCKSSNVNVLILGNIVAPYDISRFEDSDSNRWITFDSINGLKIQGPGQIDGQGSIWWKCRETNKCDDAPTAVYIKSCNGFQLNGVNFINSPRMHLVLHGCTGVRISQLKITAPEESPNTDGIHIGHSEQVEISDSIIRTGDDCISIGTETSNINISRITCGPGHGISIGSLGESGSKAAVKQIYVSKSNFARTMNGLRIKTWQGGSGFARDIKFEDITLNEVDNPIIIDQYYCNGNHNCKNKTSAVEVSNVSFLRVSGSSSKEVAINLACSKNVPCTNILLDHVQLRTTVEGKQASSYCLNAYGTSKGAVQPAVPCLRSSSS